MGLLERLPERDITGDHFYHAPWHSSPNTESVIPPGCRLLLVKSIYGLVQAGHEWNQRLKKSLEDRGFEQCPYEPGLFIKRFDDGSVIVITTYVDDLLLTSDSQAHLDDEYKHLSCRPTHRKPGGTQLAHRHAFSAFWKFHDNRPVSLHH